MKIYTLPLGQLETNCYLVADADGNAGGIDPAAAPEQILQTAREKGLHLQAILLTHGHFDHVGGIKGLVEALHCPVWMHESESTLPEYLTDGKLYYTDGYDEGDTVTVGKLTFTVLHTPGHTPGSVCLRCGEALFSGDTLFAGSYGRTDFSGGSGLEMCKSLHRLAEIPENLTVYPGHGEMTTLDAERRVNPYFR